MRTAGDAGQRQLVGAQGVPAHAAAGGVPSQRVSGNDRVPYAGGAPWVDEPPRCTGKSAVNGWPCEAPPVAGDDVCVGHRRARDKATKKDD